QTSLGDEGLLSYIQFSGPYRASIEIASAPRPGPAQAVVKTALSGISAGTERMWFNGTAAALRSGRRGYPYRPGYASVGEVIEIGDDFVGLKPGDRVFVMKPHASHVTIENKDIWFPLPSALSDEDALATSLAASAVHAVHRSGITVGDAVAVGGLGMLGMIYLQVLAATIGGPILALTRSPQKIALALAGGASHSSTYETMADILTELPPIHGAFECSGAAANVSRLMAVLASQGHLVLGGFYNDPIPIDGEALFANELALFGVRATGSAQEGNEYNRWGRRRNLQFAFDLVRTGKVQVRHLVSHRFEAAEFSEAYRLIDSCASYLQVCIDWR
ncbi:MAG TPA: zinc-binding alcohol dehydrogenase, partial [Stellaceae bacterium]|nr:zinc-binding alcohol dehydrogenase [Stellaceae bacterium]